MPDLEAIAWTDHDALNGADTGAALWWLGQAGFLIEIGGQRIVIDPYLSDTLAQKYRGKKFPHIRMMPPPVLPGDLTRIDWVLCTHGHTDHMDPGTLPDLLAANPSAKLIVPASQRELAIFRGAPVDRLRTIDAGEAMDLNGVRVVATPAAHESLAKDVLGQHQFLGYVIQGGDTSLWHSGDTIPFPGLEECLVPFDIDLTLLPVNGRDAERAGNGVPGNLTLEEALDLTDRIGGRAMIGHHLDLFEFNTLDRQEGSRHIAKAAPAFDARLAETDLCYRISAASKPSEITRVLAVCRGNICRSPLAEAVLANLLPDSQYHVDSAAIENWHVGKSPDPRSIAEASRRGLDIADQRVRQVGVSDFAEFDFILAMDAENLKTLNALRPAGSRARILLLGNFLGQGAIMEIADPYDGNAEDFEKCFEHISASSQALSRVIQRYCR